MAKSSFYSGTGTTPTNVESVSSSKAAAEASENAAAASAAAAAQSATQAGTSNTAADTAKVAAQAAQAAAETAETNAASSAASAATSLAGIGNAETNAATSASNSAASASAAAASALSASASATSAASDAASAATSLSNIGSAETNAAASATSAASSATSASTDAASASASQVAAAASEAAAATSEANSATSETNAATSASQAATSATNSATSETNAASSASSASTSASNAASSASAASASQVAAAASAASAANSYDLFDDRYLGTKTSDPAVDNDGNALVAGALYFNSTANEMRVYDGANWIAASSAGGASLLEYKYTATSGQTTFSGADDNANTLSYTQDNLIVTLNGVVLENGADYTATTGTSVVLASGAATSDELNVIAFKSFTTADMVSSANGGTFYNNIDVQGTVTADGLTVDGGYLTVDNGYGISTVGGLKYIADSDDNAPAAGLIHQFFTDNGTTKAVSIAKSGDISFYEDTGTTAKFFWDASAESLGIGGAEGQHLFGIHASGAASAILRDTSDASRGLRLSSGTAGNPALIDTNSASKLLALGINGTEAMRIDSSGNLLVGTTSSFGSSGITLGSNVVYAAASSQNVANFQRYTTDGEIVRLGKGGSTVGSIGAALGQLFIGQSNTGVILQDSNQRFAPSNADGSSNDGNMALGWNNRRWKDLYLSGGVYLGGTGSANKLDDYEEGTWTPTLAAGTPTINATSQYTKVGNLVTIFLDITYPVQTNGNDADIFSLPFTSAASIAQGAVAIYHNYSTSSNVVGIMNLNSTRLRLFNGSGLSLSLTNMSGKDLRITAQYTVS